MGGGVIHNVVTGPLCRMEWILETDELRTGWSIVYVAEQAIWTF